MAFDIASIDEIVHGKVRLGVMATLAEAGSASFSVLKTKLGVTQGNLSIHLGKLERAGYIAIDKRFEGKKPLTLVRITPTGRNAFADYLDAIARLVA